MNRSNLLRIISLILLVFVASPVNADQSQSWDKVYQGTERFRPLSKFNYEAVFDKEIGVVWEISPSGEEMDWYDAKDYCRNHTVNGIWGWRLPTGEEFATLLDRSNNPAIVSGHPFNLQRDDYWTDTTYHRASQDGENDRAVDIIFELGEEGLGNESKWFGHGVWCVRGGSSYDGQYAPF